MDIRRGVPSRLVPYIHFRPDRSAPAIEDIAAVVEPTTMPSGGFGAMKRALTASYSNRQRPSTALWSDTDVIKRLSAMQTAAYSSSVHAMISVPKYHAVSNGAGIVRDISWQWATTSPTAFPQRISNTSSRYSNPFAHGDALPVRNLREHRSCCRYGILRGRERHTDTQVTSCGRRFAPGWPDPSRFSCPRHQPRSAR